MKTWTVAGSETMVVYQEFLYEMVHETIQNW